MADPEKSKVCSSVARPVAVMATRLNMARATFVDRSMVGVGVLQRLEVRLVRTGDELKFL